MELKKWLRDKFVAKTFCIELETEHYPDEEAQRAAILQYGADNGEEITVLRATTPIVFRIDGRDCYRAKLAYVRDRLYYGYRLTCRQILDEEDICCLREEKS